MHNLFSFMPKKRKNDDEEVHKFNGKKQKTDDELFKGHFDNSGVSKLKTNKTAVMANQMGMAAPQVKRSAMFGSSSA